MFEEYVLEGDKDVDILESWIDMNEERIIFKDSRNVIKSETRSKTLV